MSDRQASTRRPRAERYPLAMPVRVRRQGRGAWLAGQTCNVSLTGVLAHLQRHDLSVGTPVEMVLGLSDDEPDRQHVVCLGRVVRLDEPSAGGLRLAVTIERYRKH
jgi:hypothetical protein